MFDTCVILAGGRGSRLGEHTLTKPKPLVEINGKPFIYFLIEHLYAYGISNIIIFSGYLGEQFDEVVMDYKNRVGLSVRKFHTEAELNTAERIYKGISLVFFYLFS